MTVNSRTRRWAPGFAVDVPAMLGVLRRGTGDPAWQRTPEGVTIAANTMAGPGSMLISVVAGEVVGTGFGDGGDAMLDTLPALLGADDDPTGFEALHPIVEQTRHRLPDLRIGACGRVWDVLLAAILEQKVTGMEAWRSWRELCRRHGTALPGGLHAPPSARAVLAITDWEWHRCGVDGGRRRAIIAAAQVAGRLERAVDLRGEAGRDLLRKVPGIGVWTAAEVAQRAWGDPDAVSVGDYHLAGMVGFALHGRKFDDDEMMAELAGYAPQRHRAVRYILAAGVRVPRRGPRFAGADFRGI